MGEEAKVIVMSNLKGGIAKSTTTINLGLEAHLLQKRVLIIDTDLQGNTTSAFGYEPSSVEQTTYTFMTKISTFQETVVPTYFDKISHMFLAPLEGNTTVLPENIVRGPDLLPCNITAAVAENALVSHPEWEMLLKETLQPVKKLYDYIFIDTNPGLGKMTVNAFICADYVVIPTVPEKWPTDGIRLICSSIEEARTFNPELKIAGILFTRVRYAEHTRLITYIRGTLLPKIHMQFPQLELRCFSSTISESAAFVAATNRRSSIILTHPIDAVSVAYWAVLAELLQRIESADFQLAVQRYTRMRDLYLQQKGTIKQKSATETLR